MRNKMIMFMVGIMSVLMISHSLLAVHADITVRVIDESGVPVEQADVEIGFKTLRAKAPGKGWGTEGEYHPAKGKTGADGMFSASDDTSPHMLVTATKPGYYESYGKVFDEKTETAYKGVLNITLRKIKNPVPMFIKRTEAIKIPLLKQDVGYDLEVGDWVAPHGKGKMADFVFNMDAVYESWDNRKCNCVISFSNAKDGIQEYLFQKEQSSYKWPYEAPESGYSSTLEKYERMTNGKSETNIIRDNYKMNYIFRVRTKSDEKGNIIEAKYGKISGDIAVDAQGYIQFNYYFNPSGSRSLEVERNLFLPGKTK